MLTHDDMEFELELKGTFWVEISSNGNCGNAHDLPLMTLVSHGSVDDDIQEP